MPHRGHRAGARPAAVHDRRIELRVAVVVERRPAAGVELRVVLHHAHGGGHRIEARAAALEDGVAGIDGRGEAGAEGGLALRRHLRALHGTPAPPWMAKAIVGSAASALAGGEQQAKDGGQVSARHGFP